jgi:hypothetical protein
MRKKESFGVICHKEIGEGVNWLKFNGYNVYNILNEKLKMSNYDEIVKDIEILLKKNPTGVLEKNIRKISFAAKFLNKDISYLDPTEYIKSSYFLQNLNDKKHDRFSNIVEALIGSKDVVIRYSPSKLMSYNSEIIPLGVENATAVPKNSRKKLGIKIPSDYNDVVGLLEYIPYNVVSL